MSHDHVTTYHYCPRTGAQSSDNQYLITPARTPRKIARRVEFDPAPNVICRPPYADELNVMQHFASHASHCLSCKDPFSVYMKGDTLCKRGHAYAIDVVQYVYSKAGEAYSVVDRDATDARVQIEIPPCCDAVRGLLKAVDQGLKITSQKLSPVVSHDQTYLGPERRWLPEQRDGYDVFKVAPRGREGGKRVKGGDGYDVLKVAPRGREEGKRVKGGNRKRDEKVQKFISVACLSVIIFLAY